MVHGVFLEKDTQLQYPQLIYMIELW